MPYNLTCNVESKDKSKLHSKNRPVIARWRGRKWTKMGEGGQKAQFLSYKIKVSPRI